jgi:hypothetical protein
MRTPRQQWCEAHHVYRDGGLTSARVDNGEPRGFGHGLAAIRYAEFAANALGVTDETVGLSEGDGPARCPAGRRLLALRIVEEAKPLLSLCAGG